MSTKIQNILPRMILDSRGFPTIEVEIILDNGMSSSACVPSGASTGDKEALELRDQQPLHWHGKGVDKAINNINSILKPKLIGLSCSNIQKRHTHLKNQRYVKIILKKNSKKLKF